MRVGVGKWNKCVCGNAEGTLLGYPISLEVSVRKASAMTAGSYPKTTIYPYRYATGGSANQLIPMTAVSGGGTASVYAPDGWDIGKAESLHENGGVKAYLVAYP